MALAGIPPFGGFWSEEEILSAAIKNNFFLAALMIVLIFLAAVYISRAGAALLIDGSDEGKIETKKSMLYPTLILASAAIVIGIIIKISLEKILTFSSAGEISWAWRSAEICAGVAGVLFGYSRVKNRGVVPAFTKVFSYPSVAIDKIVELPAQTVLSLSKVIVKIENVFDSAADSLSKAAFALSGVTKKSEVIFDKCAGEISNLTLSSAKISAEADDKGISKGLDSFAKIIGALGGKLKNLAVWKNLSLHNDPFSLGIIYRNIIRVYKNLLTTKKINLC